MMFLKVSEIFYSIQGEGRRVGEASIFIRLQGCSAKYACYAGGVRCDTEFESGKEMTLEEILNHIQRLTLKCKWIIFTGGEPLDQLAVEHIQYFRKEGYRIAVETSGIHPLPIKGIFDWLVVSPKVAEHVIKKNFEDGEIDELRYVRHSGQTIPSDEIIAKHYYLSPHFSGLQPEPQSIIHCIELIKGNPKWSLSLQLHKILGVL